MSKKEQFIVGRISSKHPGGRFRRSGLTFTATPTAYDVSGLTEERRQAILDDPTIIKVEKGEMYRQAIAAAKGEVTPDQEEEGEGDSTNDPKMSDPSNPPAGGDGDKKDDEGEDEDEEGDESTTDQTSTIPHISKINKAEIIAELEKKGMKAGEDFSEEATKADLYALLTA